MLLLGGALVLGGCQAPTFGAFRGATAQGKDEFKLWVGMIIAGLVVAVIVWGLIFWAIVRYRRRDRTRSRASSTATCPLEIIYTVIPLIIVGVIFFYTVDHREQDRRRRRPTRPRSSRARLRWGWSFTYDDGNGQSPGRDGPDRGRADAARASRRPPRSTPSSCCPTNRRSGSCSSRPTSCTASTSRRSTSAATPCPASRTSSTSRRIERGLRRPVHPVLRPLPLRDALQRAGRQPEQPSRPG